MREVNKMINYYTYNNGTKWAINFRGLSLQLTSEIESLIRKAPNNWDTKKEAEEWVKANS